MKLRPLTEADMEQVRMWRHGVPESLRTPYMLTQEMQADYYRNVICDRDSTTRYWGLWHTAGWHPEPPCWYFIGYGGIENICWENGNGEISLLLGPDYRGKGYGQQAVGLFLDQAFRHMGLKNVYGECYKCGPWKFWRKMLRVFQGPGGDHESAWLPARKYYKGEHHDSYYFTFDAESYCGDTGEDRIKADTSKEHTRLRREADNQILNTGGP